MASDGLFSPYHKVNPNAAAQPVYQRKSDDDKPGHHAHV